MSEDQNVSSKTSRRETSFHISHEMLEVKNVSATQLTDESGCEPRKYEKEMKLVQVSCANTTCTSRISTTYSV